MNSTLPSSIIKLKTNRFINRFFIFTTNSFPFIREFFIVVYCFFLDCLVRRFWSGFPNTLGLSCIIPILCLKQSTGSIKSDETSKRDIRKPFRQCIDSDCKLVPQYIAYIYLYICPSVDVRDCRSDSQSELSILDTFSILPHLSLIPFSFRESLSLFFTRY